jgi:predicted RND superfamily exporter protein
MDGWLERLMAGARRRARTVIVSTAVLALAGVALVSRVSFDTNILRLLPRHSPAVQGFKTFLETFGSLDHLYLVFESADNVNDHKDLIDAYVSALRAAPEIESVDAQLLEPDRDWTYLSDRVMLLLGPFGAADALQRFQPPRVDRELAHARDMLSMPSAEIKTYVQQDPLGLIGTLRKRLEQEKGAIAFDPTQEGYVSRDGRSRLVIVKPRGAPFDADFCKALFSRLAQVDKTARAAARDAGGGDAAVEIQAAGSYRISLEAERVIRRESIVNAVGSLVLLLLIVLAVFRTPWILLVGTAPLALAAVLSLGLNGLIRGRLSPATSGSAGMLFGLGIDGVILLYVRYLEEQARGASPLDATRRMAGTASSVVLAQATSVATFLALLALDFPTLEDLGSLVGLGMLLVCPLTLVLLPALLTRRQETSFRSAPATPWLGRLVTKHSRTLAAIGIVLTIGGAVAARGLTVDTRIERLQARTPGADFERQIAVRFGLPEDVLLAVNENEHLEPLIEADRRLTETVARRDASISVSGISLLLPPAREQAAVARTLTTSNQTLADVERSVRSAGERAGFRPDTFAPFFSRLPKLLDPQQRITYDGLIDHGLAPVVSRFLVRQNGGYAAVTYLYPSRPVELAALEAVVHEADPRLQLTGLSMVNRDMALRFVPEFTKGIVIGTAAVVLLIYATFRSMRFTWLALLPTAAGFAWSAGLLAIFKVQLDVFSLFAALTSIGIAVDYGIYVLYRHAIEGIAIDDVLARTGAAIGIACLTALVGFGTLINSSYPPLRTFGAVSVVTLTCCLAAALLFLPALILQMHSWSRPAR